MHRSLGTPATPETNAQILRLPVAPMGSFPSAMPDTSASSKWLKILVVSPTLLVVQTMHALPRSWCSFFSCSGLFCFSSVPSSHFVSNFTSTQLVFPLRVSPFAVRVFFGSHLLRLLSELLSSWLCQLCADSPKSGNSVWVSGWVQHPCWPRESVDAHCGEEVQGAAEWWRTGASSPAGGTPSVTSGDSKDDDSVATTVSISAAAASALTGNRRPARPGAAHSVGTTRSSAGKPSACSQWEVNQQYSAATATGSQCVFCLVSCHFPRPTLMTALRVFERWTVRCDFALTRCSPATRVPWARANASSSFTCAAAVNPRPDHNNRRCSDFLQILSWNPGLARGSDPSTLASHLNLPWHVVCVQEGAGFVTDGSQAEKFHVITKHHHCLNKNTFDSGYTCTPIQFPCTHRYSSWTLEGMVVTGKLRRPPDPACQYFTVPTCTSTTSVQKRRSVAEHPIHLALTSRLPTCTSTTSAPNADLSVLPCFSWCATFKLGDVALTGDFNKGAVRELLSGGSDDQRRISPLEAAFGVTPLWGPGSEFHGKGWPECCGFVKMPESQDKWLIMRHGAFDVVPASSGLKSM